MTMALTKLAALLCVAPAGAMQTYLAQREGLAADGQQVPPGAPQMPDTHGCYVWLPNGCRSKTHALHAKMHWKRDEWGEANVRSGDSPEACQARKESYDGFCRVRDSVMLYVSGASQAGGVYNDAPAAMAPPSVPQNAYDAAPAMAPQSMPMAAAAAAQVNAVAASGEPLPDGFPQLPETHGCYVWLPNGCRSKTHALHAKLHWKRDDWGEANVRSGDSAAGCQARKENYDGFCRVRDSVMLFVQGAPAESGGGVYSDAPAAMAPESPAQPKGVYNMVNNGDVPSLAQGAKHFVHAGVVDEEEDVEGMVVPAALFGIAQGQPMPEGAPQLPDTNGCYIWLPNGCRSKTHALHAKMHWKRDEWGEANARAGDSAEACQARKEAYDGFCRVRDSVMLYVNGANGQLAAPQNGGGVYSDAPAAMAPPSMPQQSVYGGDAAPAMVPQVAPVPVQVGAVGVAASGQLLPEGAPQLPETHGCYIWLPNGCRSKTHALHAKMHWKRDEWGEANMRSAESAEACQARKESYDGFCRVRDSVMLFVQG